MSICFVVAPLIAVGGMALAEVINKGASSLGYRAVKQAESIIAQKELEQDRVEIALASDGVVADSMARESEFVVQRDDIVATFKREPDGRCVVHVSAPNRPKHELEKIGKELVGKVTQQYAYGKVMAELKDKGFSVNSEEVDSDQSIRISVSKYV